MWFISMVVTSLTGAIGDNCNIVSKYCLFISSNFKYTVYFIIVVYCVAFCCNSNSCSSENMSFFHFPAEWTASAGKRKNEMFSLLQLFMAPMSDVTTIDINHIYRDSKFRKLSFFSRKIVICNDCKWQKSFFCIDLSKYRLITNCWNSLPMPFNNSRPRCAKCAMMHTMLWDFL